MNKDLEYLTELQKLTIERRKKLEKIINEGRVSKMSYRDIAKETGWNHPESVRLELKRLGLDKSNASIAICCDRMDRWYKRGLIKQDNNGYYYQFEDDNEYKVTKIFSIPITKCPNCFETIKKNEKK